MSLAVATCGDTLTINVTQPFVSEGFSRAIVSTLSQLGITARACDRGLEAYDILKRNAVADLS
ncbi:MAG: hypothetical protein IKF78_13440 [Atopobiaceae bacterium]|nr:hypothetical protein [Atopobiaceae bacterium]